MAVEEDEGEESSDSESKSNPKPEPYNWLTNFHRDLIAGAFMGGVVHTITAPIERTKVILQTQESNINIVAEPHRKFKGMFDCIVRTVREKAFSLSGEAMLAVSFAITPLLPSISLLRFP
ncbi:unnamed protein product [Camellia sinensis]